MAMTIRNSVGLNGVNDAADVLSVKSRLIDLGFDWLTPDGVIGPITIQTIRLFQAIKNGFNRVDDQRLDGRVDVGGELSKWLNAVNAPQWQEMPAGSRAQGFSNDELADTDDNHDFGTSWLAETIRETAVVYQASFLISHSGAAVIHINDISLPRGGPTPMHATHQAGMCCDIRLPRKDGGAGGITVQDSSYDRASMKAMLKSFWKQKMASRILLSDEVLVGQGLCIAATGHHNHAHFEVQPPPRLMPEE